MGGGCALVKDVLTLCLCWKANPCFFFYVFLTIVFFIVYHSFSLFSGNALSPFVRMFFLVAESPSFLQNVILFCWNILLFFWNHFLIGKNRLISGIELSIVCWTSLFSFSLFNWDKFHFGMFDFTALSMTIFFFFLFMTIGYEIWFNVLVRTSIFGCLSYCNISSV